MKKAFYPNLGDLSINYGFAQADPTFAVDPTPALCQDRTKYEQSSYWRYFINALLHLQ